MKNHHVFMRLWSLLGCGLLTFVSLANNAWLEGLPSAAPLGIGLAIAIVAVLVPHVGALLAVLALVVTFASLGNYVCAAVLAVAGLAWWYLVARDAMAQANTGLSSVLFGAVGLGAAVPLLAGYYLDVRQAVSTTAFASLLAVLLAAMGSADVSGWWPYLYWHNMGPGYFDVLVNILRAPSTWITVASWLVAAAVMAALCGFGSRPLAVLGAVLAGAVLAAGVVACTYVASGFASYVPQTQQLALPIGCAVAAAVLGALRAPDIG